jgi:hypothetical protein
MLDDDVEIDIGQDAVSNAEAVTERAGELGLLDATRLVAAPDSDVSAQELIADRIGEWILEPAAEYQSVPTEKLVSQLMNNKKFSMLFDFLTGFLGRNVLPDLAPDAAALGIGAWCWRNNTAVEDWHVSTDALMAKVSISATKGILPHVDPYEGVDWQGAEDRLTDSSWRLSDGRLDR